MKLEPILLETRKKTLEFFQQSLPTWPAYVVKDFVYSNLKDEPNKFGLFVGDWARGIGYKSAKDVVWKFETVSLTLDSFGSDTIGWMKKRKFGTENPMGVYHDPERQAGATRRLIKSGVSKEPIIMTLRTDGKYELVEGWHRTMQSLQMWPNGYRQSVYVAIEKDK
jgi:hypothetical protein